VAEQNAVDLLHGSSFYTALLEAFEEGQQVIIRLVATGPTVHRRRLIERLLLEFETGMEIHLRGVHRLVPKPQGDHRTVNTAVQQRHRGAVAQDMRRDLFALEGGAVLLCGGHMFGHQIRYTRTVKIFEYTIFSQLLALP